MFFAKKDDSHNAAHQANMSDTAKGYILQKKTSHSEESRWPEGSISMRTRFTQPYCEKPTWITNLVNGMRCSKFMKRMRDAKGVKPAQIKNVVLQRSVL